MAPILGNLWAGRFHCSVLQPIKILGNLQYRGNNQGQCECMQLPMLGKVCTKHFLSRKCTCYLNNLTLYIFLVTLSLLCRTRRSSYILFTSKKQSRARGGGVQGLEKRGRGSKSGGEQGRRGRGGGRARSKCKSNVRKGFQEIALLTRIQPQHHSQPGDKEAGHLSTERQRNSQSQRIDKGTANHSRERKEQRIIAQSQRQRNCQSQLRDKMNSQSKHREKGKPNQIVRPRRSHTSTIAERHAKHQSLPRDKRTGNHNRDKEKSIIADRQRDS